MKSRKIVLLAMSLSLCFGARLLAENPGSVMAEGFTRGMVNMVTCPAEIPRYICVDTTESGALGVGTGLFKGIFSMPIRAFFGALDVISLGSIPAGSSQWTAYGMEPYVWDERWSEPEDKNPNSHRKPSDPLYIFW